MIIHPPASRHRHLGLPGLDPVERTGRALARRLDDGYHWFRDLVPGGAERIEAVVVGPGGTWTLAVARERGRFRRRNGHWYRWNGSTESWVPWEARPVTEARMAGHRLSLLLERAGLPATVNACLLTGRSTEISAESGEHPGLELQADPESLAARIVRDEVLTPAQVDRIAALLDPRQPLPRLAPSTPPG